MVGKRIIVLIIVHQDSIDAYQEHSIKQCFLKLHAYDIVFICPEGLDVSVYRSLSARAVFDFIDPKWQSNYHNFNRLKIESYLYERYKNYDYILFYEPDAFVFNDDLPFWASLGYDNIGGPWFKNFDGKMISNTGNGGLCLRNVHRVLETHQKRKWLFLPRLMFQLFRDIPARYTWKYKWIILKMTFPVFQRSDKFIRIFPFYEDKFWAIAAPIINPKFNVCPASVAMRFSFDSKPKYLFQLNNNNLPFGTHGWYKHDRWPFWKDYISVES